MKAFFITFLTAMIPVAELRAAIPLGFSMGLPLPLSVMASVLGNMVPVPFIILFIRRIFAWLRLHLAGLDRVVSGLEARAERKRGAIVRYGMIGLCFLVAIPLPGTGAWTGSLVAALMDIRLKRAVPAIFLGVLIAALLVGAITYGVSSLGG